jgi:hypothetical protein
VDGGRSPAAEAHFVRHTEGLLRTIRFGWKLVLSVGACACGARGPVPPGSSAQAAHAAATRPDSECYAIVAQALADSTLHRVLPAALDSLVLPPPDRPIDLRGQMFAIRLFVDAHGGVVLDSTRIDPPIADRGYDRAFRGRLARYRFRPALLRGCAVPSWFVIRLTL